MQSFPRKLQKADPLDEFSCGVPELDQWLTKYAYVNLRANNAVTYVVLGDGRVVGYYALAVAAVEREAAPERLGGPDRPHQGPCLLIARLATDVEFQGRGIGAGLLRDALERSAQLSESIGAAAVLVHARDETAKAFYRANGDFLDSPIDPLHLMAPMKDVWRAFLPQS